MNFDGRGSDEVRRFVIDNALMWLRDYHCDGLRLDAVHAIVDQSAATSSKSWPTRWMPWRRTLAGRCSSSPRATSTTPASCAARDAGGFGLDAAWADEWHHALHAALTGERSGYYEDFGSLAAAGQGPPPGVGLRRRAGPPHRQRVHGRPPVGLRGHQFVVCTQNHDQVGNRALGERLQRPHERGRACEVAAALLLTGPFTPMLFQGEEWGGDDAVPVLHRPQGPGARPGGERGPPPRVRRLRLGSRRGARPAGGGHVRSVQAPLGRGLAALPTPRLLAWYRQLLALRRHIPALADPRLARTDVTFDENAGWLLVRRAEYLIAVNLGAALASLPVAQPARLLLSSSPSIRLDEGALNLPPDSVAILQLW